MKRFFICFLVIGTAMFASAQTYSIRDLQKHVENINSRSPVVTSAGDYILNETLLDGVLYNTVVMPNSSSFKQLADNPTIFKNALVSAYAEESTGKMLVDTNTVFIITWICKNGTYPPVQIIIRPEEIRAKM